MADSDTLINSLNQQISTLQRELAQTRAESRNRKIQLRTQSEQLAGVTKERDDLAASVASVTTERDQARAQLTAAPGELQTRITELTDQIRTRDHKARFATLAKTAGCDESVVDAAWDLAGYKAEADEPDDARITEALERVKSRLPMAFKTTQTGQANGAASNASKKTPLAAGVGSDRGSPGTASNRLRVTKAQMRDHAFMKANQKAIAEASAAGSFEIIDG